MICPRSYGKSVSESREGLSLQLLVLGCLYGLWQIFMSGLNSSPLRPMERVPLTSRGSESSPHNETASCFLILCPLANHQEKTRRT